MKRVLAITVVLVAVAWISLYYLCLYRSVGNCRAINENRREGNNRADVLKEFMESAADAREKIGHQEEKLDPETAVIDLGAAARYRQLELELHHLPERDC